MERSRKQGGGDSGTGKEREATDEDLGEVGRVVAVMVGEGGGRIAMFSFKGREEEGGRITGLGRGWEGLNGGGMVAGKGGEGL
ncbi:hypothetical protein Acr_10g0005330 [Actinidia rufa]|uniref:Uncharacterized protein n=1 Tax=Actinidia rufa TaxID=165716 RepID=A0A7J0F8W0_9ERIC|nr:hypothetical protein Acr_10g0005330 [Actinidia rufa]